MTDEDGQNSTDNEDFTTNANNNLPVLEKPRKQSQPAIRRKALPVTSVLEDTGEYQDSDGYESIPFKDDPTTKPGPSGQHQINGKLKSALKQIPRSEPHHMVQAPDNQRIIGDSSTSNPWPRNQNQKKGTTSGAGNDQGHVGLPAEEGSQWKSPQACRPPTWADANVPSPQTKKPWKAAPPHKKPQKAAPPRKNPQKAAKSGRAPI
ncbi:hypothetical protein BKA83DRAFT_4498452 [Pisolithus microcarpus]|nr:hypothetical protein BKA83DRAFT_4498452 [Pisolithus microcarpus]